MRSLTPFKKFLAIFLAAMIGMIIWNELSSAQKKLDPLFTDMGKGVLITIKKDDCSTFLKKLNALQKKYGVLQTNSGYKVTYPENKKQTHIFFVTTENNEKTVLFVRVRKEDLSRLSYLEYTVNTQGIYTTEKAKDSVLSDFRQIIQ